MRVHIDFSIFSTPLIPLGSATGIIELAALPGVGGPVRWPCTAHPVPEVARVALRADVVTNVWNDAHVAGADASVMTEGLFHECEEDARETVAYLEAAFGLTFCEY